MYLKRLDIQGFKSFADKMEFVFNPGVTVVVGPNGSGKSNISDSIRWVIGEQSAKSLRGSKMEDIIFAGSDKRKPVGMAEVSITFDNSAGLFALDYSEITVTRRVFRSGESEFLINKVPCRLKDIHELFMDTGIGKEAYSIIGQGKIDEILSTKSEDRRMLIEEAAGIIKYRSRKNEANRKLNDTEQNLLRISDIILELEGQIEPLGDQAAKAEEYLTYKSELRDLEVNLFVHQLEELKEKLVSAYQTKEELNNKIIMEETSISSLDSAVETLKLEVSQMDEIISQLQQKLYDNNTQLERKESDIRIGEERNSTFEGQIQRLTKEIEGLETKVESLQESHSHELSSVSEMDRKLAEHQELLNSKEEELYSVNSGLGRQEEGIENLKSDLIDLLNSSAGKKNSLASLDNEKSHINRRIDTLNSNETDTQNEIAKSLEIKNRISKNIGDIKSNIEKVNTKGRALQEGKIGDEKRLKENKDQFLSFRGEEQRVNSRLKLLKEMEEEYEGYQKGVKEVLKAHKKGTHCQGVCGVVAELIDVPAKYETAIEVALGGALQNVVTETDTDAKAAINYLKAQKSGRATFLPLNTIQPQGAKEGEKEALKQPGALGLAKDLVSYDNKYSKVADYLLGRYVVVENIDFAVAIAKRTGYKVRLVTLDGDIINPGGSLTGGSYNRKSSNLLGRSREIQDLTNQGIKIAQQIKELINEENSLNRKISEVTEEIIQLQKEYQQQQIVLAGYEKDLLQIENDINRFEKNIEVFNLEIEQLNLQLEEIKDKQVNITVEINEIDKLQENKNNEIAIQQKEIKDRVGLGSSLSEEVTALKVKLAELEQEKRGLTQALERYHAAKKSFEDEIEIKRNEIAEIITKQSEERQEIENNKRITKELVNQRQIIETELGNKRADRQTSAIKLEETETKAKAGQKQLNDFKDKLHSIEVKEARLEIEVETNQNRLYDEYELSYEQALLQKTEIQNRREVTSRIKQLKQLIHDLGNVNVNAIEEFAKVQERYHFLSQQYIDLEDAKVQLYKVIEEMEKIMVQRFSEAFSAINTNFQEVFQQLFGGGRAELKITDSENILETGIDIIAQPPGKKPQHLSLLSGGERALTAIALLFAILKLKPSPFCILDEIEAALDEANVDRYAEFLKEFSQKTQFVVISHRKGTMEVADVLYGVTMDENGVSKLISMEMKPWAS